MSSNWIAYSPSTSRSEVGCSYGYAPLWRRFLDSNLEGEGMAEIVLVMLVMFLAGMFFGFELGRIVK